MATESAGQAARITALTVADLVAVLGKSGSRHVTEASIRADIAAGAPVNEDGTVNLLRFAAWLLRRETGAD